MMRRFVQALIGAMALLLGLFGVFLVLEGDRLSVDQGEIALPRQDQAYRPIVLDVSASDVPDLANLHYLALDEGERATYEALYQGISDREKTFSITVPDSGDIEAALHALMADHPEFFWLTGACTYQDQITGATSVDLEYNVPEGRLDEAQAAIDAGVASFLETLPAGASAYDKVRLAYEWVVGETDYGRGSKQHQNIQSVFVDHESVCAGYAKAYQYLLSSVGVPCAYVRGRIVDADVEHAWNVVNIDGTLTYVDVTWGDPTYTGAGSESVTDAVSYDYCCLTTDEMERTGHMVAENEPVPVCASSAYDYYRLSGLLFDVYDKGVTDTAFRTAFQAGRASLSFKFSNDDAYAAARDALDDASMLEGTFTELAAQRQGATDAVRYQTTSNDALRILTVFW